MTSNLKYAPRVATTQLILVALAAYATAQPFDLAWHTIDGGGTQSTGGPFSVAGTIGQADAGQPMSGAGFELMGGYWPAAATAAPPCAGDLDSDGDVDLQDLATLLAHFGTPGGATFAQGDGDADGDVDLSDLTIFLANFGTTCP